MEEKSAAFSNKKQGELRCILEQKISTQIEILGSPIAS